jgi:hypothetical protein
MSSLLGFVALVVVQLTKFLGTLRVTTGFFLLIAIGYIFYLKDKTSMPDSTRLKDGLMRSGSLLLVITDRLRRDSCRSRI